LEAFRDGRLTIVELQSAVGIAPSGTQSIDQHELRELLDWAEGNLDSVRFTHQPEDQRAAARDRLDRLERALHPVASK
jgi:hypothetical protein